MKSKNLLKSFGYAFAGIWYCLRKERNYKVHMIAAVCVCALAWYDELNRYQWSLLVITVMCVLMVEMINTAFELVVDMLSPEFHPTAKIIKDVAAGAVLVASISAFVIGILLFF
jgi:undecaprenol kinase